MGRRSKSIKMGGTGRLSELLYTPQSATEAWRSFLGERRVSILHATQLRPCHSRSGRRLALLVHQGACIKLDLVGGQGPNSWESRCGRPSGSTSLISARMTGRTFAPFGGGEGNSGSIQGFDGPIPPGGGCGIRGSPQSYLPPCLLKETCFFVPGILFGRGVIGRDGAGRVTEGGWRGHQGTSS